jgi:hypothetical protein
MNPTSSLSAVKVEKLDWTGMDNVSIISSSPFIGNINKVFITDTKGDELWETFISRLSIAEREFVEKLTLLSDAPVADALTLAGASSSSSSSSHAIPLPVVADVPKKKILRCQTCGDTTHNKRSCSVKCYSCNQPGHKSKNCPLPKPEKQKRKADDDVDDNPQQQKKMKLPAGRPVPEYDLMIPTVVVGGDMNLNNSFSTSPVSATPTPINHHFSEDEDE